MHAGKAGCRAAGAGSSASRWAGGRCGLTASCRCTSCQRVRGASTSVSSLCPDSLPTRLIASALKWGPPTCRGGQGGAAPLVLSLPGRRPASAVRLGKCAGHPAAGRRQSWAGDRLSRCGHAPFAFLRMHRHAWVRQRARTPRDDHSRTPAVLPRQDHTPPYLGRPPRPNQTPARHSLVHEEGGGHAPGAAPPRQPRPRRRCCPHTSAAAAAPSSPWWWTAARRWRRAPRGSPSRTSSLAPQSRWPSSSLPCSCARNVVCGTGERGAGSAVRAAQGASQRERLRAFVVNQKNVRPTLAAGAEGCRKVQRNWGRSQAHSRQCALPVHAKRSARHRHRAAVQHARLLLALRQHYKGSFAAQPSRGVALAANGEPSKSWRAASRLPPSSLLAQVAICSTLLSPIEKASMRLLSCPA